MKTDVKHFTTIEELQNIDAALDSANTLVQIFCAEPNTTYIQKIQAIIKTKFPKSVFLGATSDGTIESGQFHERKSVISITQFEKTIIKDLFVDLGHSTNYFQIGKEVAQKLIDRETKVIITFADGMSVNGEEYVKGISSINNEVVVSGGMAGDNGEMKETFVFNKECITPNGIVAVSLSGKELYINNGYSFDWMPIGKEMRVTKAVGNKVYEIDGKSVIDIYAKYLGKDIAKQLPKTGIEFPLVFKKGDIYIGRAVIGRCDDGGLIYAGNIPEGTMVRFGVGNISLIVRDASYSIESSIKKYTLKPEAIFIYSCMARRRLLGHYVSYELQMLESVAPSGGFFTYGEFYKDEGNEFFNETLTFLLLSEDNTKKINSRTIVSHKNIEEMNTVHALANLANVVSMELEELNKNLSKRVEESTQEIYKQAYYDKLTGLPNRLSLIKRLHESVGEVIFLINVDDFTSINDFYGHAFGDKVLEKLSVILQGFVQTQDGELYKLPSDEFAIILKVPYQYSLIEEMIQTIIFMVENYHFVIDDIRIYLRVAIATALINSDGLGLANADISLKMAKKSSKAYMIYNNDANILKRYEQNLNMVNLLKEAIEEDKILAYYQPIYDAKTQQVVKYEALVRLKKSEDKILSPYAFLETSKKVRLYQHITKMMIDKTCEYFSQNKQEFSINFDFEDILNQSTREYFIQKVKAAGIEDQVTVEILETTELTAENEVLQHIKTFRELGIKIAIDDFGSGFANFEYLTKINATYIKLDGSIIKNIDKDLNTQIIVDTIIGFAKKMGLKTIAEFVHSKEVYEIVKDLGVDYVQGYYFAEPKPKIP